MSEKKAVKIVVLDSYILDPEESQKYRFEKFGPTTYYQMTPAHLTVERIGDADIVFADETILDRPVIEQCPGIRFIGVLGTGTNGVDLACAGERGIPVANIPGYGTESVAQHAFALLMAATNHIREYDSYVKKGCWKKEGVKFWNRPMLELSGKTIGVIGYGPIAKRFMEMVRPFGVEILVCTGHPDCSDKEGGYKFVTAEELYCRSHIISIHRPLTDKSLFMINDKAIGSMRDGVVLVNTARGKLIEKSALEKGLASGKVGYACLDATYPEPFPQDEPLLKFENCLITPHMGWTSAEARGRLFDAAIANLESFLEGGRLNWVNM